MKTNTLIVIAAAIGLSGAAHAEEGKGPRPPHKLPPEVIAKFDKDGDGKLNEEERAELRKTMPNHPGGPKRPKGQPPFPRPPVWPPALSTAFTQKANS